MIVSSNNVLEGCGDELQQECGFAERLMSEFQSALGFGCRPENMRTRMYGRQANSTREAGGGRQSFDSRRT